MPVIDHIFLEPDSVIVPHATIMTSHSTENESLDARKPLVLVVVSSRQSGIIVTREFVDWRKKRCSVVRKNLNSKVTGRCRNVVWWCY